MIECALTARCLIGLVCWRPSAARKFETISCSMFIFRKAPVNTVEQARSCVEIKHQFRKSCKLRVPKPLLRSGMVSGRSFFRLRRPLAAVPSVWPRALEPFQLPTVCREIRRLSSLKQLYPLSPNPITCFCLTDEFH